MTDPGLADATYVEPITPEMVEKIIMRGKNRMRIAADHGWTNRAEYGHGHSTQRGILAKYMAWI